MPPRMLEFDTTLDVVLPQANNQHSAYRMFQLREQETCGHGTGKATTGPARPSVRRDHEMEPGGARAWMAGTERSARTACRLNCTLDSRAVDANYPGTRCAIGTAHRKLTRLCGTVLASHKSF